MAMGPVLVSGYPGQKEKLEKKLLVSFMILLLRGGHSSAMRDACFLLGCMYWVYATKSSSGKRTAEPWSSTYTWNVVVERLVDDSMPK